MGANVVHDELLSFSGRIRTYIHTFYGPLDMSGITWMSQYQNQSGFYWSKRLSGSSISWDICKSAPRPRQITMPAPYHWVFLHTGCPSCVQPTASKHWRHYIKQNWQITFNIHPFGTYNLLCHFVGSVKTVLPNTHWHAL